MCGRLLTQTAQWHQKNAVKSGFQITAFVRDTGMIVVGLGVIDMQNQQTWGMVAFWDSRNICDVLELSQTPDGLGLHS